MLYPNTNPSNGDEDHDFLGKLLQLANTGPAIPTGSATAANQATQITAEQAIQALLGGTGSLKAAPASAAALANVASSGSTGTLQALNANRRGLLIFNDSTAILYVKFGATASATSYTVQIAAGGYWEMPQPIYTGVVDGIWASANGNARMTELT